MILEKQIQGPQEEARN